MTAAPAEGADEMNVHAGPEEQLKTSASVAKLHKGLNEN
jgi:hypothetical protein